VARCGIPGAPLPDAPAASGPTTPTDSANDEDPHENVADDEPIGGGGGGGIGDDASASKVSGLAAGVAEVGGARTVGGPKGRSERFSPGKGWDGKTGGGVEAAAVALAMAAWAKGRLGGAGSDIPSACMQEIQHMPRSMGVGGRGGEGWEVRKGAAVWEAGGHAKVGRWGWEGRGEGGTRCSSPAPTKFNLCWVTFWGTHLSSTTSEWCAAYHASLSWLHVLCPSLPRLGLGRGQRGGRAGAGGGGILRERSQTCARSSAC